MMIATTSSGVDASARLRPVSATSVWPGVVHPEVQPAGEQTAQDRQRQEDAVTGMPAITGCLSNHGTP